MKETQLNHKDSLKVSEERQIEKKKSLIGHSKFHKGHKVFEIDLKTGIIYFAKVIETVEIKNGKAVNKRRVDMKENCYYVNALNVKNAKKVFNREIQKIKGLKNV